MALLEREALLEEVLGLFEGVKQRHGLLLMLGGEAGVGKSVFVRHASQAVSEMASVWVGLCDPLSTPKPLGPLLDIAAMMGGELEQLLEAEDRNQLFQGFLRVLQRAPGPSVVVFEDVHWADEATLDLLRFLGRRLSTTHSLLIATYRDDEVGAKHPLRIVMGDLATSGALRRLKLSPLSQEAVTLLAKDSPFDPEQLYGQTGGNPFFVTEVLASRQGIPATVRDAVLARAARLTPEATEALEVAAVVGARTEPWLLQALGVKQEAVAACVDAGMLYWQGESFSFRHELAREAVYASLRPQRRAALHQQVLGVLKNRDDSDLASLAHHAEAAGDEAAVLQYAPAAARKAVELSAHREAVAQYAKALRVADKLPPQERAELLEACATESAITDLSLEAIRLRREAIDIWRREGNHPKEAENLVMLSSLLVGMGQNAEAEEASQLAIRLLEALPPSPELALAYWYQAHLRMLNRDNAEAVGWAEKALKLAEAFGDANLLIKVYNALGAAQLMAGNDEAGVANILKSAELAKADNFDAGVAGAYSMLGTGSGELYKFARAEHYLNENIAITSRLDLDNSRFYCTSWLALVYLHQGRWSDATDTALSVVMRPSVATISRIMALIALGRVRARRGDPEVWTVLDEALELAVKTNTLQRLAPVHAARAEAAWLGGDREKTLQEACAAYDLALRYKHPWFVGELAYWRWKVGDLREPPAEAARPFAAQISGGWAEAAAAWQHLGCPYEAARALAESSDEAALRKAHEAFEGLSARPAAASLERLMRELGLKGLPRGPRPSTLANPAKLTRRELEVLALLAEGRSNADIAAALFRSPKTIDHHVSAILAKLGVHNRTEAVREAIHLGLLGQNREAQEIN